MTPKWPAREDALRLFRERFLNRTDLVAILAPWGKPSPVEANGTLDALLLGHLFGDEVPTATVKYRNRRGVGVMQGRYRVGAYCPGLDDTTRWLCLDFDGAGHADALADPQAAALASFEAFRAAELPAYLERSGGGKGWHLWCFFDPPLGAAKAQALGRALAPKDAPLADSSGEMADPRSARGIEVFPKQPKLHKRGFGNLVWLPWWQGAAEGGNAFYRRGEDGALEPYVPTELATAPPELVGKVLAAHAPPEGLPRSPVPRPHIPSPSSSSVVASSGDTVWAAWRQRALAALPIDAVYGEWLTGSVAGAGWLECRDPASTTGDQHPSAGVADGAGEAERGTFHSFISGKTLSVFDFLIEHGGATDFRAARQRVAELSSTPEPPALADGDELKVTSPLSLRRRPRIVIRTDEHAVVDEAIAALARIDGVYRRGQLLVHVVEDDSPLAGVIYPAGSQRIFALGPAGIRDRLTFAAEWVSLRERQGDREEVPAHPPTWVISEIEARKRWPKMPYLAGVIESPVLRPDGSLLQKPGHDTSTGLLYLPNARYPIAPVAPTKEDAVAAAAELLDVVIDFPFKTDAHRAAWLAGVLTPLARYAFFGPSPMFLMDANIRSAGKTLLVDVTGEIVAGRAMPRTPQAPDENEEIKRITATAIEGTRLVLIDNINRPLGSGALDTVLTGTAWSERILGKSEKVDLPLLAVWYATGNNITFKGDTARRCLHVRLDSNLEKPEYREDFKHPDLQSWVRDNRARLVMAALTMLRAYCVAGKPPMGLKKWGSFEGWSNLVRNAVVWAGLADPGATRAELDEVDTDSNAFADLLAGWEELPNNWGTKGCSVARVLEALHDDVEGMQYQRLRSALAELCPHPPGQLPNARKVGYALRRFRGRVADGRKLQTRIAAGNNLWLVERVGAHASDTSTAAPLSRQLEEEELMKL